MGPGRRTNNQLAGSRKWLPEISPEVSMKPYSYMSLAWIAAPSITEEATPHDATFRWEELCGHGSFAVLFAPDFMWTTSEFRSYMAEIDL
jgi:hypothetical protein